MKFINCKGQSISYKFIERGEGPTFVFANSLGTDLRIWDEVIPHLKGVGSVLCFDKPGHGLSQTASGTGSVAAYVDILVALLDALQIERCVFIGLSIGGLMGQLLAVKYPEKVERLILSNTAAKIGDPVYWDRRIEKVKQNGLHPLSDMILNRWLPANFCQQNRTTVEGMRRMLEGVSVAGYINAVEAIRDADFTEMLRLINVPTLCVAGSKDLSVATDEVKALAELIPGATMLEMQGVGHIPGVEAPREFAQLVLDFVAQKPAEIVNTAEDAC